MDVQMPDGTIITGVPEGATKADVLAKYQKMSPDAAPSQRSGSMLADVGSQFNQGALFGLADEATAGIAGLMAAADKGSLKDLGSDYEQFLGMQRGYDQAFKDENPLSALALNVAGGLATGYGASKGVAAAAPETAGILQAYGKANPIRTTAGVGGISGGVYAAGAGEGGLSERLEQAGQGSALGVALGGVGASVVPFAGRQLGNVFHKLTNRNVPTVSDDVASTELFPKTAGQKTQNVDLQRLENNSMAGLVSPKAQEAAFTTRANQNKEFKSYLNRLGGELEQGRDINAIVDDLGATVKQNYEQIKGQVSNAYEIAGQGQGVRLKSDDIRQGLWKNIAHVRREGSYDLSQMPQARSVVKKLARYSKGGGNISAVEIGKLENFRKQATNALASTQDKTEKRFIGQIVGQYDDFMEQTAANAAEASDADAIKAFREAVKLRSQQGRIFEKNKFVNDLATGNLSVDDARRKLIGTGAIKGQAKMTENLDALIKAAGDQKDIVKADLQNVFIKNIYNQSKEGLEQGTDAVNISPAKLKTNLENLFVQQSSFAEKLYGKEAVTQARQAIKELEQISKSQPSVRNPSGSGELMARMLNPIIDRIPGVGHAAAILRKGGQLVGEQRQTAQAIEAFSGKVPRSFQTIQESVPQSTLWSNSVVPTGIVSGESVYPMIEIRNTGGR